MSAKSRIALVSECVQGFSVGGSVRGVARTEKGKDGIVLSVSLVRLAPVTYGKYLACYLGGGFYKAVLSDLSGGKFLLPNGAEEGGAFAVVYVGDGYKTVAVGGFGKDVGAKEFEEYAEMYEKAGGKRPQEKGGEEKKYDDEAVATENYYGYPDVDADSLTVGEEDGQKSVYAGDTAERTYSGEKETGEEKEDFGDSFRARSGEPSYYEKIEKELGGIFGKFPEEKSLGQMVAGGRWAKVSYDGEKHYVVGVIEEDGKPRYVCFGVPGKYGKRPAEFTGYCSFIPISPFDLKGDGYWVIFQDAETGAAL